MSTNHSATAIIRIHCPDQRGIVARVTDFIHRNNGNIVALDQHTDRDEKRFFMRVEWELEGFELSREQIEPAFEFAIATPCKMKWKLHFSDKTPRMGLFVSKMSHCLYDILARYQSGEMKVEIPVIISNHKDLEEVVGKFGIPFVHVPVTAETKAQQEQKALDILKEHEVDFLVLARYMQILSPKFVDHYPERIINIHHSFLPAFIGAKPYHAAHARGVKIIGATSHYVTSDLDAGPIIEQDVSRISHHDTVERLIQKGRDIEKIVLSRAVMAHIERKTLVYKNRTVVFQ
ncbi:formyltetrahydrofolate deformylase [Alkalitalea saponilacus]|uniref:Formyltetrahydrofolate deformylase n=1 Tax=Alkalitalea saponilacus TaxID=889453 RepID=A0A1T5HTU5_9BACT|nr:formyltetrahydrofolate deformylase [Alkalitalea saponilacus]ASB48492.1 formyltetrahydrofolate deformylase [Alkalitalea saponilacus]SKC24094.1 formyltetrahydrofolate deformylase [Alkalitalea saponilacus]